MIVYFRLDGVDRHERTSLWNANFARAEIEARFPGAIITLILPGPRR
jgi:hypothetical protein